MVAGDRPESVTVHTVPPALEIALLGPPRVRRDGEPVAFDTRKAIALLAIEYKAPIVVGYARRLGDEFRYEVGCAELIDPSDWETQPEPVRYITQRYTAALERIIRESPEQYLWLHRRWKHQPRSAVRKPHLTTDHRPQMTAERTSPTPG